MIKTTVYLDPETVLALRQIAHTRRKKPAELIREALLLYTRQAVRPQPKGIGHYRSGRSDISEQAEDILRDASKRKLWP